MKKIVFLLSIGLLLLSCDPQENPDPVIPSVTTGDVTDITTTTAICGGNVTADGGAAVTARGVCWSTSENPTTLDSKTTDDLAQKTKAADGTGLGTYTSNITGLSPNTTYYVRAYATNSVGTAYGEQRTFTTNALQGMLSVTTGDVTDITTTTATCGGNVTADGGAAVTARGVCWSTTQNPTTANSKTTNGTGLGTYTSNITGLSPNTTYYVRAYATNANGTAYGEQRTFKTQQEQDPGDGSFTDSRDGNVYSMVTIGSQVWMAENLAYLPSVVGLATGSEDDGHETDPYYYVYGYDGTSVATAKATTNYQTYGVLYNWPAALTVCPPGWHLPSDEEWTELETYLANNGYNYDGSTGGDDIRAKIAISMASATGWDADNFAFAGTIGNTNAAYDAYRNKSGFTALPGGSRHPIVAFEGIGDYGGWSSSTQYDGSYARCRYLSYETSYVTRGIGSKAYGFSVRCVQGHALPIVNTGDVTNITTTTATCSGNVTSDGGSSVTVRGVCWSTSENPTTVNSKTTDGEGVGDFTSNLTGLSPNTIYHIRAYATNAKGTSYGEQKTFTTNEEHTTPTVTTGDLANITTTTATCSDNNVTADGGASVTARGVCWSTSENPTTSNSKTTDGAGTGAFTSNLTSLSPNTTYYIRAYATNAVGTSYGEQRSFESQPEGVYEPGVYRVAQMGTLGSIINQTQKDTITTMIVLGVINKADFEVMRTQMPQLRYLDLKDVTCEGEKIPDLAFYYNESINVIILPHSITKIESHAFCGCTGLTGSLILPSGLTTIESGAFMGCTGLTGSLNLPDGLTTIGEGAFNNCSGFTGSLTLPEGLTTVGTSTFNECSGFTGSLTLPEGLTTIGNYAFNDCSGFTGSLTLPEGLTTIGIWAFSNCTGFTGSLILPAELTTIGSYAFSYCTGFTGSLILPDGLTTIGDYGFRRCTGFTGSLILPDGLTTIGDGVFSNCTGFTGSLILPAGLTNVGSYAFGFCSGFTGTLNLPDALITIENGAFTFCTGLNELVIGNNITTIHDNAFSYCSNFSGNVVFPISLISIRNKGFLGCNNVDAFRFPHTTPPPYYTEMLPSGTTVEVPTSAVDTYKATDGWKAYNIVGY